MEERAAFFANNNNNSNGIANTSPSPSASYPPSSYECLDTAAMEALEAGTAPLTGRAPQPPSEERPGGEDESLLRRSLAWLDQGLGLMDGAVDRVVARWTDDDDDDGGDDGLLLPMAGR